MHDAWEGCGGWTAKALLSNQRQSQKTKRNLSGKRPIDGKRRLLLPGAFGDPNQVWLETAVVDRYNL